MADLSMLGLQGRLARSVLRLGDRPPILLAVLPQPRKPVMAHKPAVATPIVTENIPANAGQISAVASANAPFIYFEDASAFGPLNGIGRITLETSRLMQ